MINKRELSDAIAKCEENVSNYRDCQRLATMYTIYDHLYGKPNAEEIGEVIIQACGDSEFLKAIKGKSAESVWQVMDELMTIIAENDERLYEHIMSQI
jgi:hypothetical protein